MRIITFATLREYSKKHADADVPLRDWYKKTEKSDWSCLADIKQTFNSVDYVGNDRFVFNIKGNEYGCDNLVCRQEGFHPLYRHT